MERRVMSHHYYKLRDFDFAQQLVALRKRAGLTQEDVALRIGLSEKAIRNWEGGSNYPKELNLRKLIEMYLGKNVFASGREQEEARLLWEQLHERTPHHIGPFDEPWFAALLTQWQADRMSQESHPEGSHPRAQLSFLEQHRAERWDVFLIRRLERGKFVTVVSSRISLPLFQKGRGNEMYVDYRQASRHGFGKKNSRVCSLTGPTSQS